MQLLIRSLLAFARIPNDPLYIWSTEGLSQIVDVVCLWLFGTQEVTVVQTTVDNHFVFLRIRRQYAIHPILVEIHLHTKVVFAPLFTLKAISLPEVRLLAQFLDEES